MKKTDQPLIGYFTREELQALLDAPNASTVSGIRGRAMLHLAFATGLRVGRLVRRQRQLAAPRRLAPGKEMLRMLPGHLRHDRPRVNDSATIRPLSALLHPPTPLRISTRPRGAEAYYYGRPYMRTDAINRFASSELCRSLQDGGKTPLTFLRSLSRLLEQISLGSNGRMFPTLYQ